VGLVAIEHSLALVWMGFQVGAARKKYGIDVSANDRVGERTCPTRAA
jgi:hypothetical protein